MQARRYRQQRHRQQRHRFAGRCRHALLRLIPLPIAFAMAIAMSLSSPADARHRVAATADGAVAGGGAIASPPDARRPR